MVTQVEIQTTVLKKEENSYVGLKVDICENVNDEEVPNCIP